MAKLTLTDISSGYQSADAVNANGALIEAAFENTLSRDGTTPNSMGADLDMNDNDVLNVRTITTDSLTLGGAAVTTSATTLTAAQTGKLGYDSRNASNAALAAALADGTVVTMAGYKYIVDSTATGTASATNDLSVNGLRLFGTEGVNVKAFGATGDGSTDDSTAIQNAWTYAWANPADTDNNGVTLYFPPGEYLVTTNDVFGSPGVTGQKRYGNIIGPSGIGSAKLVFKPTTGNSTFSDNKYFLYDGGLGDGASFNTFYPQFFRIKDLHIELDKTNLTTGDEIWVWRLDGEGAAQNLEFHDCRVTGTGTTSSGVNAESGVLQTVGSTNASECIFTNCRLQQLSHVLYNSNAQAVGHAFHDTHCLQIFDHFIVINEGSLEIDIRGGGFIWASSPDVTPQYMFHITSDTGNPGSSSSQVNVQHIKPEMNHVGAALVHANSQSGFVDITFQNVNFTGGSITSDGDRDVTVLNRNKNVKFVDSAIPNAWGHEFTNVDGSRSGQNWSVASCGLVEYYYCTIKGDLSAKITLTGASGRVIAKSCQGYDNAASPYNQIAVDFDSNPFVTGHKEPAPWLKTVKLVDQSVVWNGSDAFVVLLPYNSIIHRVQAIRFTGTGATSRDLKITDGDAVELATDTSTEASGFDASADISLAANTGLGKNRTTTNERTITANITTTLTGNNANGRGYIQYW